MKAMTNAEFSEWGAAQMKEDAARRTRACIRKPNVFVGVNSVFTWLRTRTWLGDIQSAGRTFHVRDRVEDEFLNHCPVQIF